MQDLPAQDSMLAVPGFEIAIAAKRATLHRPRQALAQMTSVATKACIQDGNPDPFTLIPCRLPVRSAQNVQRLLLRLDPGGRRGRCKVANSGQDAEDQNSRNYGGL